MKKYFILLAITLSTFFQLIGQVSKTISVTAGNLKTSLTAGELSTVTNLTVTGTIDARDFKTMRDNMPVLAQIDLSGTTVAAYSGTLGTVASFTNFPANAIPNNAFVNPSTLVGKTSLKSFLFPAGVTSVLYTSFRGCTGLTSINIPNLVTSIGFNSFYNCTGLTSVTLPIPLTSIGQLAFYNCTGLTSINVNAFIPANLSASNSVFFNVNKATCVLHVPYGRSALYAAADQWKDFTNIVSAANGFSLASFTINLEAAAGSTGSDVITSNVTWSAVSDQSWLVPGPTSFTGNSTLTVTAEANSSVATRTANVTISASGMTSQTIIVNQIGSSKTVNNTAGGLLSALTSGELNTVSNLILTGNIDARDFKTMRDNMPLLIRIDLSGANLVAYSGPDGTNSLGTDYQANTIPAMAFLNPNNGIGKTNLTSILLPLTTLSVGDMAFYGCTGLTSVDVPSSITSIGTSSFYGCSGLTSVNLPTSLKSISSNAFSGCVKLTSITLPFSLNSIGTSAFSDCTGLTSLYANPSVPVVLNSSPGVFTNVNIATCVLHVPYDPLARYSTANQWMDFTHIVSAANGISLSSSAISFEQPGGSSSSVSVTSNVAWSLVSDQSWLVATPATLTGNSALTLTATANPLIGTRSATITISSTGTISQTVTITQKGFPKTAGTTAGNLISTLTADELSRISDLTLTGTIDARDFKTMRDHMPLLARIDLSGAAIVDYLGTDGTNSGSLDYPADVIPDYAFSNPQTSVSKTSLTTIIPPSSATTVGVYAFNGCTGLTTLTLPSSLISINLMAFYNCSGLTSLMLPASVTTVGDNSFANCTGLTNMHLSSSLNSIGFSSFQGCNALTTLTIPASVTAIGQMAFNGCSGLTSIYANPITPVDLTSSMDVFGGVDKTTCVLNVPQDSWGLYSMANQWSDFINYVAIAPYGIIGFAQSICPGTTPDPLSSEAPGSGPGVISYRWEYSTDGSVWLSAGGTGETYAPGVLSVTTQFRRVAISTVGGISIDLGATNPLLISMRPPTTITAYSPAAITRCQGAGFLNANTDAVNALTVLYSMDPVTSAFAGNAIDQNTGQLTFAAGWSGVTTITATATGCGPPALTTLLVTTNPPVTIAPFSPATSARCQGAGTVTTTTTASHNSAPIVYSLDATTAAFAGNSINSATGAVTYAAGWVGTTTITASAAGCGGPVTTTLVVTNNGPVVITPYLPATSTRCQGAGTDTRTTTATYNLSDIVYSLDATTAAFPGNSINSSTGVITYASGWSGTTIITATASGCGGPVTTTHVVTITPAVTIAPFSSPTATRCQESGFVTTTTTASHNTSIVQYSLDATSASFPGNSFNSITGEVDYAADWVGTTTITASATGCMGPATTTLVVTTTPTVTIAPFSPATSTRCQGAGSVTTTTTATNNSAPIVYSLDAITAAFSGNSINYASGSVTYAAGWSGTTTITASAAGCSGPVTTTHVVTINPPVTIAPFSPATSSRTMGAGTVTTTTSAVNNSAPIVYSLDATTAAFSGNSINSATGAVTYAAGWSGTTTITASAAGCGGPATTSLVVTTPSTITVTAGNLSAILGASQLSTLTTLTLTGTIDARDFKTMRDNMPLLAQIDLSRATIAAYTGTGGTGGSGNISYPSNGVPENAFLDGSFFGKTSLKTIILPVSTTSIGNSSFNSCPELISCIIPSSVISIGASAFLKCSGLTSFDISSAVTFIGLNAFTGSHCSISVDVNNANYSSIDGVLFDKNQTNLLYCPTTKTGPFIIPSTIVSIGLHAFEGCSGLTSIFIPQSVININGWAFDGCAGLTSVSIPSSVNLIGGNAFADCAGLTTIYSYSAAPVNLNSSPNVFGNVNSSSCILKVPSLSLALYGAANQWKDFTHIVEIASPGSIVYDQVFCTGLAPKPLTSSVDGSGPGTITYRWEYSTDGTTWTPTGTSLATYSPGVLTQTTQYRRITISTDNGSLAESGPTVPVIMTVNPLVAILPFSPATSTRCQIAQTITRTTIATDNAGTIVYSLDAATAAFPGNSINSNTGAVTYAAGWVNQTTITATASGVCGNPVSTSHLVTIASPVTISPFSPATSERLMGAGTVTTTTTAINNSAPIVYSLDATTAAFSGNSINSSTGAVTYAEDWSGTTTITASAAGCGGPATATLGVTTQLCAGIPTPGNTIATSGLVCPGVPFALTLASPGTGFEYQWQSSPDGIIWSNLTPTPITLINTNFSTQPSYTNIYGASTQITGGELILTPVTSLYTGGFVIQSTPGSNVTPFSVNFDYRLFDGSGADGISLSYASNITNDAGTGEAGEGSGLIVKFDSFDNATNISASQILIYYGGYPIWSNSVGVLNLRNSAYRTVNLLVDGNGYLSLTLAGTTIVSGLLLPGYLAADKTNWKFKFSGRTGSYTDKQSIDNLGILVGETSSTKSTITAAETISTYYRCNVTCSGNTVPSNPVFVNIVSPPTFTTQPGASATPNADVTYTTESGKTNYVWTIPGVLNTDYSITSGGTNVDNSVTLKWLTTGSKTVTINYSNSVGCNAVAATLSTATQVSYPVPAITSFTPSSGPVGTLVTITGTNLGTPTAFTIGGVSAIAVSNNGSTLVGMVMPGAVTGSISVTTGGGTATGGSNFTVTPTPYPGVQQGSKLVGTGAVGNAQQGWSVSVSADGNTAIVGGFADNNFVGAAWIYTRSGGVWTQQGSKLVGTGAINQSEQGWSVSLSADGNTAIVGGDLDNNGFGAAWIWTHSGNIWTQQGNKLVGTGAISYAWQGYSVSLSADGNTALVGGIYDNTHVGAAWIWTRSGGVWTQQGNKLVGTGAIGPAQQGYSISLSADGNTAIIGGLYDNNNVGAAWIWTRSGGAWSQQGNKLVGTGAIGQSYQGKSVSVSADGNTAIVGGYLDNSYIGAAWIWTRSGSVWTQQGSKLVGTGAIGDPQQGNSVSLSADGNTAIVTGNSDSYGFGASWIFTRSGNIWTQQGNKMDGTGAIGGANQGISVSLSADGKTTLVGGYNDNSAFGAAWVFIPCTPPPAPSASGTTICSGNSAALSASGTGMLGWYDAATGGNWLHGGGSFTTPTLFATTIYYVQDSTCNASATRTAVTVTVNALPSPTFTAQPGASATPNADVTYTTESGKTNYVWTIPGVLNTDYSITSGGTTVDNSVTLKWLTTGSKTVTINYSNLAGCIAVAGTSSTATQVSYPAPAITSFTPSTGPVGTLVTITGTNLGTPTAFTIGGVSAIAVSNDGSTLVGMVMPGAATGTVSVTTGGGTATGGSNFTVTPTPYPSIQQGSKLVGTGASGSAQQGYSVSLSADGNTAIVGGYNDNGGIGAAWIYTRSGGVWSQQGNKLVGTGAVGSSLQGWSVSLSADGKTALVGGFADNGLIGAAWIYTRSGGVWSQQGNKLVGTGAVGSSYQGVSVSLSADGSTAFVGGNQDNNGVGAAWIYTRSGGVWTQQGNKLVGTGAVGSSIQGISVSLSADGNTAIVGGYYNNNYVGAAWIYTRSGGVWSQQGNKLVGTGAVGSSYQGISLSLSADGNTAIVGGDNDNNGVGAAWIYTRSGGVWTQQGNKLVGTGTIGSAYQGRSVSLSADGNTAIVGGHYDSAGVGAVWIWTRSGGTWTQKGTKLVGTTYSYSEQGFSVSLSADGNTAIVGGYNDNGGVGATWVFVPCTPPPAPSASGTTICSGNSAALSASGTGMLGWYDAATGGNWLHGGNNFTTPTLSTTTNYYVQDSTCNASITRTAVTVTVTSPAVSAAPSVCVGSNITLSPTSGGTWISSDPLKATVTNAGLVTGVAAGTVTFTYTQTSTGCSTTTPSVTVNALPVINAASSVCVGSTISLSPTTGGTWISSDPLKATVTDAGLVTGVAAGSITFTYTQTSSGCSNTTSLVTITPSVTIAPFSPSTSSRVMGAGTVTTATTATDNSVPIVYSLDATTAAFSGNSIDSATGAVTYAAGWSGTTTITASAAGCNGPVTTALVVTTTSPILSLNVTAGSLSTVLTASQLSSVTSLTLTGTIDARDFKTMRDDMPLLSQIDIGGATVVAYSGTGGTYLNYWVYPANAVPLYAFRSMANPGGPKLSLTSIVLPSSVTLIDQGAFQGCSGLTSVTLPSSLVTIGGGSFASCSGLSSILIPSTVTNLDYNAFSACSGLTSISIPPSVTSIGNTAFGYCSALVSVSLSSSLTSINEMVFTDCSSLSSVTIPSSVTSIGVQAFQNCVALTSLTIPNSVTSIGSRAFQNCSSATSLSISTSLAFIDNYVFQSCSGLTSVTIPSSVGYLGNGAFAYCSGLTNVTIPSSVTSIGAGAFNGCSGLTSVSIPTSVTTIGSQAFQNCTSLTSVTIPSSVISIESSTFYGCGALTSVTIPSSINSIGASAFSYCNKLTTVAIPASVTSIGTQAFFACVGLTSIYANGATPVNLNGSPGVFSYVNTTTCTLHVPAASLALYAAANQWQDFIHAAACVECVTHFIPVWTGNGQDQMNIDIVQAQINAADLVAGDEVGVFDGDLCVGMIKLSQVINQAIPASLGLIRVSKADPGLSNGYTPGDPILFKIWDVSQQMEKTASQVEFLNPANGQTITPVPFTVGGTAFVRLSWLNTPPVANAGIDQSVNEGDLVTLDGSGSSDAEHDNLTYQWVQTSGAAVVLANPGTAAPTFTAPAETLNADFGFALTVNDGTVNSAADNVIVTVRPLPKHFVPVWTGHGQDQMNFNVFSAKLDGTDLEPGDEIGLYDGTRCVGAGILQGTLSNSSLLIMVASADDGSGNGYTPGHAITYRVYDKSADKEITGVTAAYNSSNPAWSIDGIYAIGATTFVGLSASSTVIQQVSLSSGWNIFSLRVIPGNPNMASIVQPQISGGSLIKVMDETGKALENWGVFGGWLNNIGNLQNTKGYKINVSSSTTLSVEGVAALLPMDIILKTGWNIISWPSANEQDGKGVMQPLIDSGMLKKVMDQTGKSIEDWGSLGGWQNNIGNFKPGEGYKIYANGNCTLTVNSIGTKSTEIIPSLLPSSYYVPVYSGNGDDHMNINLIDISQSGLKAGDQVGIFDGQYCVGAVTITSEQLKAGNVSIPTSSNDGLSKDANGFTAGNKVEIELFRENHTYKLDQLIIKGDNSFEKNGSLFVSVSSKELSLIPITGELDRFTCYPNPFADEVTISISNSKESDVEVVIYNLLGQQIKKIFKGSNNGELILKWNGTNDSGQQVTTGVYLCKVNDQFRKIVFEGGR